MTTQIRYTSLHMCGGPIPVSLTAEERAENPLLGLWFDTLPEMDDPYAIAERFYERHKARMQGIVRYAWAIPDDHALRTIAAHGPLVEMFAGSGYWASLLRRRGVDVVAYDLAPGQYLGTNLTATNIHFPVRQGGPEELAGHSDRTLLMVWPPLYGGTEHDEDGEQEADIACLDHWHGSTLVYVGESANGCTGSRAFHERLEAEFETVETVSIPQWPGLHDYLTVYRRKSS